MEQNNSNVQELQNRLLQRSARIAVIGLGYAGLPLLCNIALAGFSTVGVDKDKNRVHLLEDNISPFPDVSNDLLHQIEDRTSFTDSYAVIQQCDVSIICVPTPLKDQYPDLSTVIDVAQSLKNVLSERHLVVLESTTYPGTTEEILRPILETPPFSVGENLFLAYSPERIDPGNTVFSLKNTPKLVSGVTPSCTLLVQILYNTFVNDVVVVSSPAVAEAAKVLENTYRFVNIALVNEFAIFCNELNLNVWDVIAAAATKPYGFAAFRPGSGVGGHCIPIDPNYLSWKARQHGTPLHLVEVARDTNERMPDFVVHRISDILNRTGQALSTARVLVLGVTYKPGVPDIRESSSVHVIRKLVRKGVQVSYHDPFISSLQIDNDYLQCVDQLHEELENADLVVVATNHPQYDWEIVKASARYIFDTCGVYRSCVSSKIFLL